MRLNELNVITRKKIGDEINRYFHSQVSCQERINACSMMLLCRNLDDGSFKILIDLLLDITPEGDDFHMLCQTLAMLNEGMI